MAGDRGRSTNGRGRGRGRDTPGRGTPQQGRGTPQQGRGAHAAFSPAADYNTPGNSSRGRGRGRGGSSSNSPWFGDNRGTPSSAGRGAGRGAGGRFTPQALQSTPSAAPAPSAVSGTAAVDAADRELLLISRDAKMHHVWEVRLGRCWPAGACCSHTHRTCSTSNR